VPSGCRRGAERVSRPHQLINDFVLFFGKVADRFQVAGEFSNRFGQAFVDLVDMIG
jgi:hypothetical protein